MKGLYILIALTVSSLFTIAQSFNQDVQDIIEEVNQDSLIFYLRNISGEDAVIINGASETIEHRVSNWGNDLAADYIFQTLEEFGLDTYMQEYAAEGKNVYAIQEGTEYPDEYYMICAHYDATAYYCADDNGSGTAGVLEAARLFSEMQFEYSIIFALWDQEEIGLIGSGYYAGEAASNDEEILGVINMDMIAWDGDEDMVVEIHSSYQASSNVLADYIVEVDDLYSLEVTPTIKNPGTTASDHSKFWNNGYPAVLIIEEYYGQDFNPYYHSDEDRIAILSMPYFYEMAKLSIGSLASLATPSTQTGFGESFSTAGIQLFNYPNPFSLETTISYTLEHNQAVRISVINSLGCEVSLLENRMKQKGDHQLRFDARNLPRGFYFLQVQTDSGIDSHKMLRR